MFHSHERPPVSKSDKEKSQDELKEYFSLSQKEYPDEEPSVNVSMEYGTVSSDDRYIAVGAQARACVSAGVFRHNEFRVYQGR